MLKISKMPLKLGVSLLVLVSSCAVHASENSPQQFIFGNYGAYLKTPTFNYGYDIKTHAANQYTVGSGVVLKQHHRIKLGYTFSEFKGSGDNSDYAHHNTIFTQYDYLLSVTTNINLTAGAMAGYQFTTQKDEKAMMDGPVVGAQVGAEYRYQQFGFEVGYHYNVHLKDHKYKDGDKETQKADHTMTIGVNYYFQ